MIVVRLYFLLNEYHNFERSSWFIKLGLEITSWMKSERDRKFMFAVILPFL